MKSYLVFVFTFLFASVRAQDVSSKINISNNPNIIDYGSGLLVDHDETIHALWTGYYYQLNAPIIITG